MSEWEKDYPLVEKGTEPGGTRVIEARVYYHLGGMNYFSGSTEPRGYYLGCTPIEKGPDFTKFTGFSGIKVLIKTVNRKSPKAAQEAIALAMPKVDELVQRVCAKNNVHLQENIIC